MKPRSAEGELNKKQKALIGLGNVVVENVLRSRTILWDAHHFEIATTFMI